MCQRVAVVQVHEKSTKLKITKMARLTPSGNIITSGNISPNTPRSRSVYKLSKHHVQCFSAVKVSFEELLELLYLVIHHDRYHSYTVVTVL